MKIYTKAGDAGTTGLRGGHRVSKADLRPETNGTLDELNVELGALVALLPKDDVAVPELVFVQRKLFLMGSRVATLPNGPELESLESISLEMSEALERGIDRMLAELPPLKVFVLPGGHPIAVQAHKARAICRRAERRLVALASQDAEGHGSHHFQMDLLYVNRLSDYLYAVARYYNHVNGVAEEPYK